MFTPGQTFTLKSGTPGRVMWLSAERDDCHIWVYVELTYHRGRKHWTELTCFTEQELEEKIR